MNKNAILLFFCLGLMLGSAGAQAQSAKNTSSRDEFWGTPKVATRGASADAVGAREANLDKKLNLYETGKKRNFKITKYNNNKKLMEFEKREKKMLKNYKRQKKQLARRRD